jgi:hypothetical protein
MPQYTKRLLVGCRKNDLILSFLLRCVFLGDANLPFVRGSCAVVVVVVSPLSTFLNNPTSKFLWFWFLGLVGSACEAVWNDNVWWSVRFFRAMDGAVL